MRQGLDPAVAARLLVNSLQGPILRAKVDKTGRSMADLQAMVTALLFT